MTPSDIPRPQLLTFDAAKWLNFDAVDRDNVKWHLVETSAYQASISQECAEATYWAAECKRLAKKRESVVLITYKDRPHKRVNKDGDTVLTDGTDDYAKACFAVDQEANELRALENLWLYRRDELRGYLDAFESKRVYLATLGGIFRGELEMHQDKK